MLGIGGLERRPWLRGVLRCGLMLAAASLAVIPAAGTASAAVAPNPGAVGGTSTVLPAGTVTLTQAEQALLPILTHLRTLYQQMEQATQEYDSLGAQLQQAQAGEQKLNAQLANAQAQVDAGTVIAGEMAQQQYAAGGFSQLAQLIFADDPQTALHGKELLDAASQSQASLLKKLHTDEQVLAKAQTAADAARQHVAQLLAQQGKQKDGITKQLTGVEQLVSGLTGAQRQELSLLEQKEADAAQLALLASGVLGNQGTKPSAEGAQAIAYAFGQLGKPYVWGGDGPEVYDCSGLTSQSWLHAGTAIPRTSEMQWADLTHVPLDELRPGDLIVYFQDASHVAMYIGGGMVVEAPHPGAFVDIEPMAVDPILGAVRPDPQNPSIGGTYTLPYAPPGSNGPVPIGPTLPAGTPTPKPTPKPTPRPTPKPSPSGSPTGLPTGMPSGWPSGSPSGSPSTSPSPSTSGSPSTSPSPSATGSASATL
ncbi:C40 family peptidase [Streptacidiphilus fuscans]|uniref:C40 family peptidase n=1 Tax=Streptacidiphilus fuscans TaxID=2789292 RepID=A0A931AZE7_9ACTN|nr:NlpC/P60 family protein [Streptacidiphilus fuscans]MBF9067526.1 C40 family peptidase [Streptacidiphilus fuscans]